MLLIEKKTIEENKEHVENTDGSSEFVIPIEFLLTHSKEVEVVDMIDEKAYLEIGENIYVWLNNNGYKLIKIKQ